jgi:hypothetical protein
MQTEGFYDPFVCFLFCWLQIRLHLQSQTSKMKKFFLTLFSFAFLIVNAHIEPPKTKKEKQDALAKYARNKAARIAESKLFSVQPDNSEIIMMHSHFDAEGREKSLMLYDKSGELTALVVQTYDIHGNLVLDADLSSDGKLQEMNVLQYDRDGLIWNIISYDSAWAISGSLAYELIPEINEVYVTKTIKTNKTQYTISYHYEKGLDEGECTGIVQSDEEGKLMMRVENIFDAEGLRVEKRIYNPDETLNFSYHYRYNGKGDFVEIRKTGVDGKLQRNDSYTYNDKGLVQSLKVKDAEGKTITHQRFEYVYSER